MPYSRTSSTAAHKLARPLAFSVFLLTAVAAHADVMQDCVVKEKHVEGIHSCVVAAEQRSVRQLREASLAITQRLRTADDKRAFRSYAAGEVNLIHERKKICELAVKVAAQAKADVELARLSCQADVNFAHLADLAARYP